MRTQELSAENFDEVTSGPGTVVVDFWAPWCGPCRSFAPVFDAAATARPDVTFAKVNTDDEQALAAQLGIMSIPTLMVFRDGELVHQAAGAMGAAAFDALVDRHTS